MIAAPDDVDKGILYRKRGGEAEGSFSRRFSISSAGFFGDSERPGILPNISACDIWCNANIRYTGGRTKHCTMMIGATAMQKVPLDLSAVVLQISITSLAS